MKKVTYTREAVKALRRIDGATRKRIVAKIDKLASTPGELSANVKKLQGSSYFRLRVGDWRVIYTEDMTVIAVIRIAARGDVYKT